MWLQTAFIFLQGAALVGALIAVRRGLVAPLVVLGAVILFSRGLGSLFSHFAFEADASPVMQVLVHYARIAPNTVLLICVCVIQARRYRAVRNNDLLRVWFQRAPYVHGAAFLISLVGDLAAPAQLLGGAESISPAAFFFEVPGYVLGIVYGGIASVAFFGTARAKAGPPRLSQRLQNLFWGIAMAGFSMLLVYASVWRGIRAYYPEGLTEILVGQMSQVEVAFFLPYAGGIVAGIFAYYAQSKSGRFVERFLSFLELVGDLTEELANAPVSRGKLNLPYTAMLQATGKEFLNLSPADKRRADNAFRVKAFRERTESDGEGELRNSARLARGISRRRLHDLAKTYEEELKEPVLAAGLRGEVNGKELPETLRDLLPISPGEGGPDVPGRQGLSEALSLALRTEDAGEEPDSASSPEWEQLVYAALADAGLLSERRKEHVQSGASVSEKVLEAYRLARYKVQHYGEDLTLPWDGR